MRSFSSCQSKDTFARRPSSAPALMVCILLKNRCPSWSIKCWPGSGKMLTLLIFSPVQLSSPPSVQQFDYYESSPMFLRRSSLTSSLDDKDDGFLDIMDDNMEVRPCHLNWHPFKWCFSWMDFISLSAPKKNSQTLLRFTWLHFIICPTFVWQHSCHPTGRLWDADGNVQLAHSPSGGWQRSRGLCKFQSCLVQP